MPIGQKELARILGVNQSTISRALMGSKEVSPEVKRKICEFADKVKYHPSYIGRTFSSQRTKVISLLRAGQFFFAEVHSNILKELQEAVRDKGYRLRLDSLDDYEVLQAEGSADGFIVMGEWELDINPIADSRPIIFIDCEPGPGVPLAGLGNQEGGRLAAECLLTLGHTSQCFFGHITTSEICNTRLRGWVGILEEHGLPHRIIPINTWPTKVSMVKASSAENIREAVDAGVTGFFCASDEMAFGLIRVLNEFGYVVPRDISVVGYNDLAISEGWETPVTSIRQPVREAAIAAVESVISAIDSGLPPMSTNSLPILVPRNSTAERRKPI